MIDPQYSFESDDEYKHRVVFDKRDAGIELTEEEQALLNSMNEVGGGIISDEEFEELDIAMEKWQSGKELTSEEEKIILKSINDGANMFMASPFPTGPKP